MSNKTVKCARIVIACLLSEAVVAAGIMLAISCFSIYISGDRPFTTESIADAFSSISVAIYLCIGAVILGGIAWLFLPDEEKKLRAIPDKRASIVKTEGKFDIEKCNIATIESIERAKKYELWLRVSATALCVALSIPMLIFALSSTSYTEDYNQSVTALSLYLLPWLAFMLIVGIAYSYLEPLVLDIRLKAAKKALAEAKAAGNVKEYVKKDCGCKKKAWLVRGIVLVITLALLVMGIAGDGMADVLSKAVNICTECIGLG